VGEVRVAPKTGELAVQRGIATAVQVEAALREARARREPLCSRLLAAGVSEAALAAILSEKHGVPGVDLSRTSVAVEVLALVPRGVAEADLILPLSDEGGRVHLAMSRPNDERVLAEVRFVTGREVSAYVAVKASLERAVREAYEAHASGLLRWAGSEAADGEESLAVVHPLAGDEVLEILDDEVAAGAGDEPLAEPEVEIEVAPDPDAEPLSEPPPRPGGRPLVLVVDDEAEIRQLVRRTLEAKEYAVETAADGAEALALAEALVPDLVLLDAMLPKLHGFEACRRLKSSPRTRDVPVVMMTAIYRGWRFAQDAREAYGAVDYVEKPFRLEDLLRRVEAALDTSAARRTLGGETAAPELTRARELLNGGRVADAAALLAAASKAHPHSAEVHFLLGRALRAKGDHFAAMTALERAAELRPAHFAALRALAGLYEETGFRRKATGVLEQALPAAPDDASRAAVRKDLLRLLA
jgi:DNA-binding response OmpR family regulator